MIWLREDGETANNAVARYAEAVLAKGPMAATIRTADYVQFLDDAYGDGDAILNTGKAIKDTATSCAMFAGGCCINAGAQDKRPPPKARAITTWAGVRGFIEDDPKTAKVEGSWIPYAKLVEQGGPKRGDVWYICSSAGSIGKPGTASFYSWTRWEAAANGHVGISLDDGWVTRTAEGGGSPGGTGCRMSAAPKDLRKMGRTLRGVWRPDLMAANKVTIPDGIHHTDVPAFIPLKFGDVSTRVGAVQLRLNALGYRLPLTFSRGSADKSFGNETRGAVAEFQQSKGLPVNGKIVDEATWNALFGTA